MIEICGSKIQHNPKTGDQVRVSLWDLYWDLIFGIEWDRFSNHWYDFGKKIENLDFRGCSETFLRTFDPEHFKLVFLLVVYLNHVTSLEWGHSMYRWFNPAPCNNVTSHLYHLTSHLYHLTWHHSVWKTDFRFGCSQNGLTRTSVLHHYRQNIPYLYNKLVIVFLQPIGCI